MASPAPVSKRQRTSPQIANNNDDARFTGGTKQFDALKAGGSGGGGSGGSDAAPRSPLSALNLNLAAFGGGGGSSGGGGGGRGFTTAATSNLGKNVGNLGVKNVGRVAAPPAAAAADCTDLSSITPAPSFLPHLGMSATVPMDADDSGSDSGGAVHKLNPVPIA
jgi:type IV secretion system protein TrbL